MTNNKMLELESKPMQTKLFGCPATQYVESWLQKTTLIKSL